ncbi:MAG: DUF29 family protein [Pseudomonadota bacterium]
MLKDNPSLRRTVSSSIEDAYAPAVRLATADTGFNKNRFPTTCEWSEKEIMDEDFWPE